LHYGKKSAIIDSNVYNYHAVYVKPAWAHQMKKVARIGNHIFYRYN
jgi:spore germination cell wall hydrolase CwlJ-like protein